MIGTFIDDDVFVDAMFWKHISEVQATWHTRAHTHIQTGQVNCIFIVPTFYSCKCCICMNERHFISMVFIVYIEDAKPWLTICTVKTDENKMNAIVTLRRNGAYTEWFSSVFQFIQYVRANFPEFTCIVPCGLEFILDYIVYKTLTKTGNCKIFNHIFHIFQDAFKSMLVAEQFKT